MTKDSELPFVYRGFTADGKSPKPGTKVQYRCLNCRQLTIAKQPKYGHWLALCLDCAKAFKEYKL